MSGFILETDPLTETEGFIRIVKIRLNIKNLQGDLLIAHPEETTATFESDVDAKVEQATFYLDIYREFGDENKLPVAISCKIDNTNYVLCVEDYSVILKESELPEIISSEASEFIFYQRDSLTQYTSFESSVESGFCLAYCEESQNLILQPYPKEGDEKTTAFYLDSIKYIEAFSFQTFKKSIPYNFWNINIDVFVDNPEEPDTHLESTGDRETSERLNFFKLNVHKEKVPYHLRNYFKDLLTAHPEVSNAAFESEDPAKGEQVLFDINKYRDSSDEQKGLSVAISCKVNNKNYLLCVDSNSVILKESELPKVIESETSEVIFHLKEFSNGQSSYCFESSFTKGCCLAWNIDDPKKKLILKPNSEDHIDETIGFLLEGKTTTRH